MSCTTGRHTHTEASLTIGTSTAGLTGLCILAHDALLEVPAVTRALVGASHQTHRWRATLLCRKRGVASLASRSRPGSRVRRRESPALLLTCSPCLLCSEFQTWRSYVALQQFHLLFPLMGSRTWVKHEQNRAISVWLYLLSRFGLASTVILCRESWTCLCSSVH